MPRYRYRTSALTGPWRDSETEALADAARAHQLKMEDDQPHWLVSGWIEQAALSEARQQH